MYQCRQCNEKIIAAAEIYDEYDDEIYKKCPYCGGGIEETASCLKCGEAIMSGEKAIEIGSDIYCTECAVEVTV